VAISAFVENLFKHLDFGWRRLSGEKFTLPIQQIVTQLLREEIALGNALRICFGTDSQVRGNQTDFATVIVFVREKKGAFMLIKGDREANPFNLRERMMYEVARSVEIAYYLSPIFEKFAIPVEIHVDINTDPSAKSHVALKEAMGYIKGMGYIFKAKPEAFASSYCADKVV